MSPQTPAAATMTEAGLAHARDLREARERQLALIAIATGNAAARRPAGSAAAAAAAVVASLPAKQPPLEKEPPVESEPLSEERLRTLAQIRRLGICRPVDPDAGATDIGKPAQTPP
jgi:hypothetical protein